MTAATARAPLDLRTAERMLSFVPDCEDRETWLAMGMALKSEYGDAAFDAWDRWSQGGGNYNAKACRASWRGFKARAGGIGIGTLIKFAKDGGYRFDTDDRPTHCANGLMDRFNLSSQILGHGRTMRLVFWVEILTKGLTTHIEHTCGILRLVIM